MSTSEPKDPALISQMAADSTVRGLAGRLFDETVRYRYSYNFTWLGRPIIQYPQDIIATQEIVWRAKPDVIIETGVAHGGSLILSASLLELIGGDGIVIGVDVDIRSHNRAAIEAHPLARRIRMIEGSSVDPAVVRQVTDLTRGRQRVMVLLDSNHTHDHVLRELEMYSPLVTKGSYLVVYDTVIEDMTLSSGPDRPWGKGNSPKSAVHAFLATTSRFRIDAEVHQKLLLTVAPDGYLECVED